MHILDMYMYVPSIMPLLFIADDQSIKMIVVVMARLPQSILCFVVQSKKTGCI